MYFPKAEESILCATALLHPVFSTENYRKKGLEESCMYICAQKAFVCLFRFVRFIYMDMSFAPSSSGSEDFF